MCIVIDLDVVCLVCLHNSQEMHAIFAPDSDTPDLQIAHKISTLSKLKVSVDNESLPDKICESCLEDLRAAWRFHKNCQTAAVVFQSIFKPKLKPEKVAISAPQEKVETESDRNTAPKESHTQEVNCDESVVEVPLHDATLDESQVLEIHETSAEIELQKEEDAEFFDMNQSIVEEDYLSVPETVDEEADLVEYYLTDDGLHAQQEEFSKKPSTSKNMEKIQIVTASSSRKSLLRSKREENVPPSLLPKKKQATYLRSQERTSHTQSLPKLKLKPEYTQHHYQNSEIDDDDFDIVPKNVTPQKRKLSPERRAPKICELCGNSYRYQHALNAHMRRHFQEKIFPCELCDKGFVSNVELRRHMRVHTGDKPYGCQYCDRRFSDFGSRIKHERTHTGERPYQCATCGKSFAYPHVLSVHLRTHTGEKRFQCQLCTKGFTKKAYLISHMEQHHSEHTERKAEGGGSQTTYEPSIGDTISEAGEENELQPMKSVKFEDCMYTTEYVNDGDAVSHEGDDEEIGEVDNQDDDDGNASSNILIQEDTKQVEEDEDNNEVDDEIVEVQIDDYTIRVR